jgi:hypothetical protein
MTMCIEANSLLIYNVSSYWLLDVQMNQDLISFRGCYLDKRGREVCYSTFCQLLKTEVSVVIILWT